MGVRLGHTLAVSHTLASTVGVGFSGLILYVTLPRIY